MIRAAVFEDAAAIARLEVRAWQRAYADWADPEQLATPDQRRARWATHLGEGGRTLVFEVGGTVAAFAAAGPGRDDDLDADVGELMALHVDPTAQGAGVGGSLLTEAVDLLRRDGYAEAVLWVLAENEYVRRGCERRGWRLEEGVGRDTLWAHEVRYRRVL